MGCAQSGILLMISKAPKEAIDADIPPKAPKSLGLANREAMALRSFVRLASNQFHLGSLNKAGARGRVLTGEELVLTPFQSHQNCHQCHHRQRPQWKCHSVLGTARLPCNALFRRIISKRDYFNLAHVHRSLRQQIGTMDQRKWRTLRPNRARNLTLCVLDCPSNRHNS